MNCVLMTSRSGSSLVCKILAAHGLTWQDGDEVPRQFPTGRAAGYRTFEHPGWKMTMRKVSPKKLWPLGVMVPVTEERLQIIDRFYCQLQKEDRLPDFMKCGVEFAGLFMALADWREEDIRFVKVRRPVEQIAASLARRRVGDAEYGAQVAERRFKLMDAIDGPDVHTDILVHGGMWRTSGIREALEHFGVTPNSMFIREQINARIFHE